jgi:hypothetical protein
VDGGGSASVLLLAFAFVFFVVILRRRRRICFCSGICFALALGFAFAFAFSCFSSQLDEPPRSTMPTTQQIKSSFQPAPEQVKRVEEAVEKSVSPPPQPNRPHRRIKKNLLIPITLFIALTLSPPPAHSQGCTQCLDNTAAAPPATQRAYRRAIILLTLTAGGLFVTALALFKRHH